MDKDKKNPEELTQYIAKCEEEYHKAFKTDLCANIMNCYYELKRAQRAYRVSIDRIPPPEEKDPSEDFG